MKPVLIPFSECDINDPFFDSLREDYSGFNEWFSKKSELGHIAYVEKDETGIHAFLSIKPTVECEAVGNLPAKERIKISTIKIDQSVKRTRRGEGALANALWYWKDSGISEIYVTVFPKHTELVNLLCTFGFIHSGTKENGEYILTKNRNTLDLNDVKKAFPFVSASYPKSKYLPIKSKFHDVMFQNSELRGVTHPDTELPVSNGIIKNFIATPYGTKGFDYGIGDLVFIYRMYEGNESKGFRSAVTSYCVVSNVTRIKENGIKYRTYEDFVKIVGNKTVYSEDELQSNYMKSNVFIIELTYNGFFGENNNVNLNTLRNNNLWENDIHPYNSHISREGVEKILKLGKQNVQNIIIN